MLLQHGFFTWTKDGTGTQRQGTAVLQPPQPGRQPPRPSGWVGELGQREHPREVGFEAGGRPDNKSWLLEST